MLTVMGSGGVHIPDSFFYVKEITYDHYREPSLEVTFDFGFNIYFYED